jgi:hypothetical protein
MGIDNGYAFRKSSYSGGSGGACIEVADLPDGAAVRDSKDPTGPVLEFPAGAWKAFISQVS